MRIFYVRQRGPCDRQTDRHEGTQTQRAEQRLTKPQKCKNVGLANLLVQFFHSNTHFNWLLTWIVSQLRGLGKAGPGGQLIHPLPIKSGAEVRITYGVFVLCLSKCIYHLRLGFFPLCCINSQHDFKGWGENQPIMLHDKTFHFWPLPPPPPRWKMVSARLHSLTFSIPRRFELNCNKKTFCSVIMYYARPSFTYCLVNR